MEMLDPKNPPEFAHPLSGRRSCSLAKVAREGKIDRSEMAIRGISAGGLRRSSLVRQTAGYGARPPPREAPAQAAYRSDDGHRAETADTALRIRLQSLLCAWSSLFGRRRDTA